MYSQNADNSNFLTELLGRIDRISANTSKMAETKKSRHNQRSEVAPKDRENRSAASVSTKGTAEGKIKVVVSDHPLYAARLRTGARRDRGNWKKDNKNAGATAPTRSDSNDASPAVKRNTGSARRNQAPRRREQIDRMPVGRDGAVVQTKTVKHGHYKPQLDPVLFFYGKAIGTGTSTSTRLASVAKELLEHSKYPYLMPKDIISKLTPGVARNKFLLQSNFSLEVDSEQLADRVKKVVKGEHEDLEIDTSSLKGEALLHAQFLKKQLMKNGDYSLPAKSTVFEVATGIKSPRQLLESAHWLK